MGWSRAAVQLCCFEILGEVRCQRFDFVMLFKPCDDIITFEGEVVAGGVKHGLRPGVMDFLAQNPDIYNRLVGEALSTIPIDWSLT